MVDSVVFLLFEQVVVCFFLSWMFKWNIRNIGNIDMCYSICSRYSAWQVLRKKPSAFKKYDFSHKQTPLGVSG